MWTAEERLAGFVETMEAAGVPVDPSLCVPGNYRGDAAYEATKPLMTRADRPTAIIGANNVMALGALQAILDLGFRCPADVSLVGIDDVPWSGLVRPRVTTVGAADRRYRAGGDRLPARADGGWSRGPRRRRGTSCSSRIFCPAIPAPRRVRSRSSRS